MIELQPRQRFQDNTEAVRQFRTLVDSNQFKDILAQAVADYAINSRPTSEQLDGVRTFVSLFLNFAEKPAAPPQFPVKRLTLHPDSRKAAAEAANEKHPQQPQP